MDEITVSVRYFASVREALGEGQALRVPAGLSVAALLSRLAACSQAHAAVLGSGQALRVAVNQQLADEATVLQADAEVAFFPPVTGG